MWGRGGHFLAAALVAVALAALSASPASAVCAPDPASSGNTVTCSGNDGDGFEAGIGIDNLTVNVQVGATVLDNGTSAIAVNDGNTVTIQVDDEGSIFNSGTINAATGLFAIQFCNCSAASSLTIAPSSIINGLVLGTGTQIFQLGGTGTGTFDLGLIGPGRQYDGFGTFNKIDASHWILNGIGNQDWTVLGGMLTLTQSSTINGQVGVAGGAFTNNGTVNGLVTVNGGSLAVNGTVTGAVIVNTGGTLSGIGNVGNTTINGGTLSPGNSIGMLTVQGNLVLSSAATYFVELDPFNSDRTLVTGTASIAGTVQAVFAAGTYFQRNYTILTANGGLTGTFGTLNITNLPAGFRANLTYDLNQAYVTLTAVLGPTPPTPTPPTPTPPTPFALQSALLTLRGRAAWAHYFDGERALTAAFQTLPGTSFVVTGAGQARDAALVSASADLRWANGVSLAGVFEGEFSDRTSGYAGKGVVRYQW